MSGQERFDRTMRQRSQRQPKKNPQFSGFLGITTGGENVVEIPSRLGYFWVRLRNVSNEVIQALNTTVSPIYNLPVIVERDLSSPTKYKVVGRDVDVYGSNWGSSSSYTPIHGGQHSFDKNDTGTGGDVTWIYSDQFFPFLVTPSGSDGSPNALVWPFIYHDDDGKYYCSGNTGTASLVGNNATGSANARMSLIYIDVSTGNPTILAGTTEFAEDITGTCAVLQYIPAVPDDKDIALAGVRLPTGTSVINWANLYDIREFSQKHPVGPQFGEIYVEGINTDIILAAEDTYYQVNAWSVSGSGVNGEYNDAIPDVTNDHITITRDGQYFVRWHAACYSAQKNEYEFEIFTNNGATGYPNTENYRTTSVASAVGALSGGGICNLSAGDTVELWVERKDGAGVAKTITIRAVTISVMQLGRT